MKILLADDDETLRCLGKESLTLLGTKVDTAINGQQAIEMSLNNKYDIILLDIRMPVLDGYQTLKGLKSCGFVGPIVALSADPSQSEKCIQKGFDSFFEKPYTYDELEKFMGPYL